MITNGINVYKRKDVDKVYTDVISNFFNAGYRVHTESMAGSQGERAHVHFISPDNKIMYAVTLESKSDYRADLDYMVIKVYMYDGEKYAPSDTLWYDDKYAMSVKEQKRFYVISGFYWDKNTIFTDEDGIKSVKKKKLDRRQERYARESTLSSVTFNDERAKKAVLSFMKRQYKCKSIKITDIDCVVKCIDKSDCTVRYYVRAKGGCYTLH